MGRVDRDEALRLIEGSTKNSHAVLVGRIMAVLAGLFKESEGEWEIVGLLHDLDYDSVRGEVNRHGILAAETLAGRLSAEGLDAIRAHDHRSGYTPEGQLGKALRFADALAILFEDQRLEDTVDRDAFEDALRRESTDKPWIPEIIESFSESHRIDIVIILKALLA